MTKGTGHSVDYVRIAHAPTRERNHVNDKRTAKDAVEVPSVRS